MTWMLLSCVVSSCGGGACLKRNRRNFGEKRHSHEQPLFTKLSKIDLSTLVDCLTEGTPDWEKSLTLCSLEAISTLDVDNTPIRPGSNVFFRPSRSEWIMDGFFPADAFTLAGTPFPRVFFSYACAVSLAFHVVSRPCGKLVPISVSVRASTGSKYPQFLDGFYFRSLKRLYHIPSTAVVISHTGSLSMFSCIFSKYWKYRPRQLSYGKESQQSQ